VSFLSEGSGSLTGLLTSVFPVASSVHMASDQKMRLSQGGETADVDQHIEMDISLRQPQ
jgi:hypothetical protein